MSHRMDPGSSGEGRLERRGEVDVAGAAPALASLLLAKVRRLWRGAPSHPMYPVMQEIAARADEEVSRLLAAGYEMVSLETLAERGGAGHA